MNFVVVGCGRVGAELAYRLFKNGHQVVVVDNNQKAFNRLHPDFRGRTTEGEALSVDTLERAGIETADGVALVTNSDTMNAVIGNAIRSHYPQVKQLVVRNYDPAMREMLGAFDLQFVSSTAWGAERVQELLLDPDFHAVFSAGNGEVEVYEMLITSKWDERTISNLLDGCNETICVALTRGGRAQFPTPDLKLRKDDILTVSATLEGVKVLQSRLEEGS